MLFFEIEWDEDQVRRFVHSVIDQYNRSFHDCGSHQQAVETTQEITLHTMENTAESIEELIEHTGTMH